MSGEPNGTGQPNGASNGMQEALEQRSLSIREVAEQAYNEIENSSGDSATTEGEATDTKAPASGRDPATGRFTTKSGEQSTAAPAAADPALQQQKDPSSSQTQQPQPAAPTPAASSTEAPANWAVEDRAMFGKLPQEAQSFLLKRHKDMEADYTQKTQANAAAITFAGEVAQIFVEPKMQQVMKSIDGQQISPQWAISQWAAMHQRAMDPNPEVRAGLLRDMAQRLKLDPAAVFGKATAPIVPGQEDPVLTDPALRYLADQLGGTSNKVQTLEAELQAIRREESERVAAAQTQAQREAIDAFADEKDATGKPVRPHFDAVLPQVMALFRADPNITLAAAYEQAVWMNPETRQAMLTAQTTSADQQAANARAAQAAKSNVRGKTAPVTKPDAGEGAKGLRATIAAAAEEVGL